MQEVEDASAAQDEKIDDLKSALDEEIEDRIEAVATERTRAQTQENLINANLQEEVSRATSAENQKVNKPATSPNGTAGQFLKTLGDGQTQWDVPGMPSDTQIANAVDDWLDNHPDAVTTVQDGAVSPAKLNTAVRTAYQRAGTAKFYFPSLETGGYSSATALMVVEGKTVLFDASAVNCRTAVMDYYQQLYNNGVFANIDFIVISHYHGDHIGNLDEILEAFPHDDCHAYLPLTPEGYFPDTSYLTDTLLANRANVISILNAKNVQYTEVSDVTTLTVINDFCEIELFNSTITAYTYYNNNLTFDTTNNSQLSNMYNNYSMVSLVKTGDIYSMFPGDIERGAQDYIIGTRNLPRLFLYAMHHHGIQNDDNTLFLDAIAPEWGVIQTNHTRGLESAASSFASNYAVRHLCSSAYGSHSFAVQKDGGYIMDGDEIERSGWYYSYITLYVDSEYTGTVHDGTSTHPFVNIGEALMHIKESRNLHYYIRVLARQTPYPMMWFRDINVAIDIIGVAQTGVSKPTIQCAYIRNCHALTFSNMIITGTHLNGVTNAYDTVYIGESSVQMTGCEIDSGWNSSIADNYYAIYMRMAELYFTNGEIRNTAYAFQPYRFATFITNGVTFDHVYVCYTTANVDLNIRGKDTISNCTYYIVQRDSAMNTPFNMPKYDTLAEVEALCAYNGTRVMSNPFLIGTTFYRIDGKNVVPYLHLSDYSFGERITDLNNATSLGMYSFASSAANKPSGFPSYGGTLIVNKYSANYFVQIAISNDTGTFQMALRKYNGSFTEWRYLTFEALS